MKYTLIVASILFSSFTINAQKDSGFYKSFDGTKIYYETRGSGEPVVLVHGFIANNESWKRTPVYTDLQNAGYKVISMDMRGNGRSDKPHEAKFYANDAEAKDIMGLLDELGVKSYKAVGYSRGSIIVSRLLVLDKRVQTAVMGGMGDGFTDPQWPRRIMFYKALSGEPVKELEAMVNYVKNTPSLDQQALALLQKEQPSTTAEVLNDIRQPVLVINGDKDPDNGSPDALGKMIKNATVKFVPGDHGTTLRSADFSREVLNFLKQ